MFDVKAAHRNVVYCLLCHKPQNKLPVHLARVCMKKSTPEERAPEVQKARASNRDWIRSNRTWDYKQLCDLLSDRRSRITMVKELLRRGFFIKNQPQESDLTLDPDDNSATAASPTTTMTTTAADARSATSSTIEADYSSSSCVSDQEGSRTPSSSVWMKMKGAGLHQKFPAKAKILVDFKKYLTEMRRVPNWQHQVDNVSRFLRYMQPTGDEPTLDFLSKSTETQEFVTTLQHAKMNAATILNYFKSIYKFLDYLLTRVDLQKADSQLHSSCKKYRQLLNTLRKTVYSNKTQDTRHRQDVDGASSITDCQRILRVAEPDFLRINGNLQNGLALSNTEKTMYRYYCEALLVFCHMQRPQGVENLTDAEWVNRIQHGGRVVTGTSSMKIALTLDEEAWFQLYYKQIRPDSIQHGKFSRGFFLSSSGEGVHSVSQDMNRFHEIYKLSTSKSQDVRRAVETAAKNLTADQQEAVRIYLGCGPADSRTLQPDAIVDTAVLLDSLSGNSEEASAAATSDVSIEKQTVPKNFSAFVASFPVSLEGQPPCKKQRVDSGYPEDATFYHKWRASQYAKRLEYLLSHFTLRKPTAGTVARLIAKEGWKANYPKIEEIQLLWKPAPKRTIETDTFIIRCVSEQVWPGLAIMDFGPEQGHGVVATRPFSKGEIVCDFHGKLITAPEGRALLESIHNEAVCLFFFKVGQRSLCIDAQTVPCECHPDEETIGRRINHSSKRPNLKPFQCVLKINGEDRPVILFKSVQDISIDTQLTFDYGVGRMTFSEEGMNLTWLDNQPFLDFLSNYTFSPPDRLHKGE